MQHTPGPWRVKGDSIVGPLGNTIAECFGYSVRATSADQKRRGGRESNARLIASAPDLLRALEDAEFLLRKVSNNPKEIGSMLDSLKRCAIDAREAIQSASPSNN
jgi:hypothetical protein